MNWSRTFKAMIATVFISALLIVPNGAFAASSPTVSAASAPTVENSTNYFTKVFNATAPKRALARNRAYSRKSRFERNHNVSCRIVGNTVLNLGDGWYYKLTTECFYN